MKLKPWTAALAVVLAAAAGAAWWWTRDGDAAASYRTARIERGTLQAAVAASGTVTPVTQVQISSQVSGQIKELFVDFNSEVKQGQLIARLDPETFEYRVRQSSADLEAARASVMTAQANVLQAMAQVGKARVDLSEAQRDLERKRDLVAKNFISEVEAERASALVRTLAEGLKATEAQVAVATAQAQTAQAIVKQRDAQLAQARVDLERTQIRSPVNGIVIKRSVEVGQTVAASLQAPELFVIAANLDDMQVETAIDEADIARIRDAQKVSFTIDAFPGRSFDGMVKQVRKAAVSAQNVTTYTVVVGFANPGASLLPGMTANVRIVTDSRDNVLKVPNAALRVRIAGVEPASKAHVAGRPGDGSAGASAAGGSGGMGGGGGNGNGGSGVRGDNGAASGRAAGGSLSEGAGGPLREFRDRLISGLQLSPAQVEKVDAVLAEVRPKFDELRSLSEQEQAKARERLLADLRSRIQAQLEPGQQARYQQLLAESSGRQTTTGRIHVLGADKRAVAYSVRLGISDGVSTELIVPAGAPGADALVEGATVITGVQLAGAATSARPGAPAGPRPPF